MNQKRITIENNIKLDTISKKYYVTFYYGKDSAGNNIRKTKTFADLDDARIALSKHDLEIKQGLAVQPSKITLNTAIKNHLELLSLKSEESTIYSYRTIEKHVNAHPLGKKSIKNVKPTDVKEYLLYLQTEKELSSNTALKHYNFLNSVFNLLEQQEAVARNPVRRVVAPKKVKHQADYLSIEETKAILERVKGDRLELPITIALYTGMRRSEICGLRWEHIDFNNYTIKVALNRINVGSEIVEKSHKLDTSERTINMVTELKQVLLEEKELQVNNRELLASEYVNDGYVFCFENGQAIRPNYFSEMMQTWFKKKENKDLHAVTPHELRHSFVAIAISAGVPLYEISQALGHSDIGITSRVYAHLLDNTHTGVTEGMASLLR